MGWLLQKCSLSASGPALIVFSTFVMSVGVALCVRVLRYRLLRAQSPQRRGSFFSLSIVGRRPTMPRTKASVRASRAVGNYPGRHMMNILRPYVQRAKAAQKIQRFVRGLKWRGNYARFKTELGHALRLGGRRDLRDYLQRGPLSGAEFNSLYARYNRTHKIPYYH